MISFSTLDKTQRMFSLSNVMNVTHTKKIWEKMRKKEGFHFRNLTTQFHSRQSFHSLSLGREKNKVMQEEINFSLTSLAGWFLLYLTSFLAHRSWELKLEYFQRFSMLFFCALDIAGTKTYNINKGKTWIR